MDLASFLGASYVGDTLAVPLMSFMHFMTGTNIQLTDPEAYQVASAFQVVDNSRLRAKLQEEMNDNDFMIDIICFEQNVAKMTQTGQAWDDFSYKYQRRIRGQQAINKLYTAIQNYMRSAGCDILKIFNIMDTDGSKHLSAAELLAGM